MPNGSIARKAENALRQWIDQAALRAGARLPAERELARRLGLTYNAVNRGMSRLIGSGLVERQGYILSYRPQDHPLSASPRAPFDLLISSPPQQIQQVFAELNLSVRIHAWATVEDFVRVLYKFPLAESAGLVFSAPSSCESVVWEAALARLLEKGFPCVSLGPTIFSIPSVVENWFLAMDEIFSHLTERGHTDLALMTLPSWSPVSNGVVEAWTKQCACRGLQSSIERIIYGSHVRPESAQELTKALKKQWKNVTAILVHGAIFLPRLIQALARVSLKVPENISIVSLDDPPASIHENSITCTAFDLPLAIELAFHLLQRAARAEKSPGLIRSREQASLTPRWIDRQSVMPRCPARAVSPTPVSRASLSPFFVLNADSRNRQRQAERMIQRPYDVVFGVAPDRFSSVPLKKFVNRPLNFRRGWLGDLPLHHLPAGEHLIHGVPFQTLGGPKRSDAGVIAFHSATNLTGNSRPLPDRVRLPLGAHARAVYILHGCGYTRYLQHFATYRFQGFAALLASVPLVSLGPRQENGGFDHENEAKANIQDWWPDYPQRDFPRSRMAPILGEDEGQTTTRFLYTLEWINPAPEKKIRFLEIQVEANQSTTLGILAVSLLKS